MKENMVKKKDSKKLTTINKYMRIDYSNQYITYILNYFNILMYY